MTDELFREYLTNAFLPYIQQLRENPVFAGQLGVVLMDSVWLHLSERNLRLLGEKQSWLLFSQRIPLSPFRPLSLSFLVP
jgi:hypothetical protein